MPEIFKPCIAMVCIAAIEIVALCKGKNGLMLRLAIAAIALLAGISIGELVRH